MRQFLAQTARANPVRRPYVPMLGLFVAAVLALLLWAAAAGLIWYVFG